LPLLATAFIGGVLADAVDRRRMALATDVALGAGSAALALFASIRVSAWPLYVAAAWMSAVSGLQRPSMQSLVPRLVDKDEVPAAAGLAAVAGRIGLTAGPALGGVLIASAGLVTAYVADLVSYAISLACLRMIRAMPPPEGAEPPSLAALREGFKYARSRQELIGTYVVDFVAMVFG